ncbi:alpha/beta hydrolase [Halorussus aquaticus]|uniref:Alpha/beta hydrolase n=1 Tax=Halorussus aquaticus TaxID=2953748 RepID=A0ABD5PYU4_9EURY|nr:alpha/beta fold hydrolase [Halorussus aquaticus]
MTEFGGSGTESPADDPHADRPVITAGAPIRAAEVAVVLLHGRGATAQGVVNLAEPLYRHGVAFFAPQAARSRWYPHSFLAPVERNEPHLSSALRRVDAVVDDAVAKGIPLDKVVLFGFSQGACLAAEYAARNPRRYGGVAALSGGLVGPPDARREYEGSVEETPVFVGCGDADDHVPVERVRETAETFRSLNAEVTERIYPGLEHAVNDDEMAFVGSLVERLAESGE